MEEAVAVATDGKGEERMTAGWVVASRHRPAHRRYETDKCSRRSNSSVCRERAMPSGPNLLYTSRSSMSARP